jgi:hypothetical protein
MAAISKLVRWLPKAVEATADDIARFGPQAGRVRSLLNFLPTMSDEAANVVQGAGKVSSRNPKVYKATDKAGDYAQAGNRFDLFDEAQGAAWDAPLRNITDDAKIAGYDAAGAESIADLIDLDTYRTLTNPLAAGRAADLLRTRPRYQGTPFLDVVQNLAGRGMVAGPRDVVRAGRIARAPEDVREIALTLIADGMSPADALRAARML